MIQSNSALRALAPTASGDMASSIGHVSRTPALHVFRLTLPSTDRFSPLAASDRTLQLRSALPPSFPPRHLLRLFALAGGASVDNFPVSKLHLFSGCRDWISEGEKNSSVSASNTSPFIPDSGTLVHVLVQQLQQLKLFETVPHQVNGFQRRFLPHFQEVF